MPKKLTKEEIIKRMKESQLDRKDDFSKFIYNGYHNKAILICPEHGEYETTPSNYISGHSCSKCSINIMKQKYSKTMEKFILEAKELFPNYNYSKVEYVNALTKVKIVCREHGEFLITPNRMLTKRQGCPECARKNKSSNTEEFIGKAIKLFPNYDYSKVNYYNKRTKVELICPKHGSFFIKPNDLLSNHGCPKCSRSKNNELIDKLLCEWRIEHIMEYEDERCVYKKTLPFDCFIPSKRILIEYQGRQHYEDVWSHELLQERKVKDKIKKDFALVNGYNFREITYKDNTELKLKEILSEFDIIPA